MKALRVVPVLFLLSLLPHRVYASQASITLPTTGTLSGLSLVQDVNGATAALGSQFSGGSAPSSPLQYQVWVNTSTSPATYNFYDGANWVPFGKLDTTNHLWQGLGASAIFGNIGIGSGTSASVALNISGTALTGSAQYGVFANPTFTTAATTDGVTIIAAPAIAASAAVPSTYDYYAANPSLGSGAHRVTLWPVP